MLPQGSQKRATKRRKEVKMTKRIIPMAFEGVG